MNDWDDETVANEMLLRRSLLMNVRSTFLQLGKFVFMWGFVQIILIGASVFGAIPREVHSIGGLFLTVVTLVMFILSLVGKMGGRIIGLSLLMFLMLAGQGFFIHAEGP